MEKPIQLLLLRAYGDFLITLHLASKNKLSSPIRLVASAHLEPLFKSLPITLPHNLSIEFHPFYIHQNLMGVFTNRYLFTKHCLQELLALKKFIRSNHSNTPFFLEQKKRSSLLRIFCGHPFKFIIKQQNVYESYARFFKADLAGLSNIQWPVDLAQKKVLLIPDARQSKRKISPELIQLIQRDLETKQAKFSVGYFGQTKMDEAIPANRVLYQNFNELVSLIQEHDIMIGSDSMPIHLAQFLGKPHYIVYPQTVKPQFFTPFALKHQSYFTFEDILAKQSFFLDGK
jgi:hypothetical protein